MLCLLNEQKFLVSKDKYYANDDVASSEETDAPVVLGAGLGVGSLNMQQNIIREQIKNEKLLSSKTMEIHIKQTERPYPVTRIRPLKDREPHDLQVHNLK